MMFEQLLTGRNLMLAGAIFVVMTVLKTPFKEFWESRWGQRLLPVLPLLLGLGGGCAGLCDCLTWQDKVLIGILAGFFASNFFKVGKTTVLGYGLPDSDGDGIPDALDSDSVVPASTATPTTTLPAAVPVAEKKE